jgi:voltage-gated potassium channel
MTMLSSFRHQVFRTIDNGFDSDWYDKTILGVIVLSLISVVVASVKGLPSEAMLLLHSVEIGSAAILTLDYVLRLWTADLKFPGVKAPWLLPSLAVWNLASILRALKLVRYVRSAEMIVRVVQAEKRALAASLFLITVILFVAASLMYAAESMAQPDKFPDIVTTFWWAIVTLTTVGYGDVFPITALGRVIGGFLAISGIFVVAIPTGILSGGFLNEYKKSQGEEQARRRQTPAQHRRKLRSKQ